LAFVLVLLLVLDSAFPSDYEDDDESEEDSVTIPPDIRSSSAFAEL